MRTKNVTRRRLEYLLEEWGSWESSTRLGPLVSTVCGSAERDFARHPSRFTLDEPVSGSTVPRGTPENPQLAEKVEEVLLMLCRQDQLLIVMRYARQLTPEQIAARLRTSRRGAEARLDTAIIEIWARLEDQTWAHGQ